MAFKKIIMKQHATNCFNSNAELIINHLNSDKTFELSSQKIISQKKRTQKWLWEGSACLIELIVCHFTNISKYNPFSGGLPLCYLNKEFDHSRKRFNKIQNAYHRWCFRWCLTIYLNNAEKS